jgi:hypothetical protein
MTRAGLEPATYGSKGRGLKGFYLNRAECRRQKSGDRRRASMCVAVRTPRLAVLYFGIPQGRASHASKEVSEVSREEIGEKGY